jgi:hypothetical protein
MANEIDLIYEIYSLKNTERKEIKLYFKKVKLSIAIYFNKIYLKSINLLHALRSNFLRDKHR